MLGSGVGGLGFGPRAGGWAVSGRGARGGAQAGRRAGVGGWRRPGGGLCICYSKCNKVYFSLAVHIYIYIYDLSNPTKSMYVEYVFILEYI